jgi:hypothetical protein
LTILKLTDRSTLKEGRAVINPNARYEVRDGKLLVNSEPIPLRKGIVYVALARAGWKGHEGALSTDVVESMLRLDQRVSLMALAREAQSAA